MSRPEWLVAASWLLVWIAGVVWAVMAVPPAQVTDTPSAPILVTGVALLALTVIGIVATSAWLTARSRWSLVLVFAIVITVALLGWYVAAMLAVPIPQDQPDVQDDAAGAGVVLLALPTAGVVILLTAIGFGIGSLSSRLRRRR
jgi:hypothetical protein